MSADPDRGAAQVRASMALPADLGAFLFAEVGVEAGGMPLTVLSALARLGLDPWAEAGRLAKQPDQEAASQLACSLVAQPGIRLADAGGAAARLVALLPGRVAPLRMPLAQSPGTGQQAVRRRAEVLAVMVVFTGLALLLAGHLAAGGSEAATEPPGVTAGQP